MRTSWAPPTTSTRAGPSVSDRCRRPGWQLYLLAAGVATGAYLAVGAGPARTALLVGLGLSAAAATAAGVRLGRPGRALPWWLLAAGLLASAVGDALYSTWQGTELLVIAADACYLAGYLGFAAGMLVLARARVPGRDRAGLVDALIVATGAALLAWVLLVSPQLRDPDLDPAGMAAAIVYPLVDVVLVAVAARLALDGGARPRACHLLGAAVVALLATDVGYAVQSLGGGYQAGGMLDAGWMVASACAAAAALHPSMTLLAVPAAPPPPTLGRRRLAVLAGVSLLTPALLAMEAVAGLPIDVPVVASGSALLAVLVVLRMGGLVKALTGALATLQHQALHDVLTGLANRELFIDRVEQALLRTRRLPGQVALLFIDLDDFKQVNDSLGHAAGDRLLSEVAVRLRTCLRAGDTAARLGGDEFAILLDGVSDPGLGAVVARRVLAALREPLDLHGMRVTVEASIGIATTTSGFDEAGTLLRRADVAMYAAKGGGKGRYSWFDPAGHPDDGHGGAPQAVGTGPPGLAARPQPRPGAGVAGPIGESTTSSRPCSNG
jgi:diguanylate cyclase (GGDEF)-like protein